MYQFRSFVQGHMLAVTGSLLPWKLAACTPAAVCSLLHQQQQQQACLVVATWNNHFPGLQPGAEVTESQRLCRCLHSWSNHQVPGGHVQTPAKSLPAAPTPLSELTRSPSQGHQHAHTAVQAEVQASRRQEATRTATSLTSNPHNTSHAFPALAWWQLPSMAAPQYDTLMAEGSIRKRQQQQPRKDDDLRQEQRTSVTEQPARLQSQAVVAACQVLDGRSVASGWEAELAVQVHEVTDRVGRPPGLAVVLVGNRPDSILYVTRKQEACHRAGMHVEIHALPEDVSQSQLEAAVRQLCADTKVDGVLVQLPLPPHLCEERVVEQLDPRKDVDGFHPLNMGRMLMRGRAQRLVPCTALGVMQLLDRCKVNVKGLSAVVLGDSNIVGTPLAAMLRDKGAAAVTVCHRNSYKEWYEADARVRLQRAAAHACLPRLPGPSSCGCNEDVSQSHTASSDTAQQDTQLTLDSGLPDEVTLGVGSTSCFQARHLPAVTRTADVLVVAVGVPELVRGHWVKPGAVVIDVGINVVSSSNSSSNAADRSASSSPSSSNLQVVGDVHFGEVEQVAQYLTPVPGGVGPMTIAAVLHNTIKAAQYNNGLLEW